MFYILVLAVLLYGFLNMAVFDFCFPMEDEGNLDEFIEELHPLGKAFFTPAIFVAQCEQAGIF